MRCAACERALERREEAQRFELYGRRYFVRSGCDACCRAQTWPGGSDGSLHRIGTGRTNPEQVAVVAAATQGWGLVRAQVSDIERTVA